jgi:tRNA/rRNA methyltransferase
MKNMGLDDLVLVAPRTRVGVEASRMAAHAGDVLDGRRTVADLRTALSDTTLAVGTVGRALPVGRNASSLRDLAPRIVETARTEKVALVFGPEDHGLGNAELDLCQAILVIPTADAYPSLNLAQSVIVCGYELLLAAGGRPPAPEPTGSRRQSGQGAEQAPAPGAEREALFAHLEESLAAIGFLSADNPAHIMRDLRSLFARAGLTRRDVKVWRGIARQIAWAAGRAALVESKDDGLPPAPGRPRKRPAD